MNDRRQLTKLARPFPAEFVSQVNAGGNRQADYVAHSVVTEALLYIVGPYDYEIIQPVRGAEGKVEGCLGRLTCEIDGRKTTITEVGDVTGQEKNDGERLKNASSDALKRCAMRLGLGLHLWAQGSYFLYDQLGRDAAKTDDQQSLGLDEPITCPECGRDQTEHAPRCSRRPL